MSCVVSQIFLCLPAFYWSMLEQAYLVTVSDDIRGFRLSCETCAVAINCKEELRDTETNILGLLKSE
jgi:hypothetical protein